MRPSIKRICTLGKRSYRDVLVALSAQLRLALERARRVPLLHHNLDELDLVRSRECGVVEQGRELVFARHAVRLARLALLAAERVQQMRPFPAEVEDGGKNIVSAVAREKKRRAHQLEMSLYLRVMPCR